MKIILLSGGSGTRLWPLSNDARSKQFLRLLDKDGRGKEKTSADGFWEKESMVQRVIRQLRASGIEADVTVATSAAQKDSVVSQLGESVNIVTEPTRRDTFPAICLACEYLSKELGCGSEETVVVMPCDPYTEMGYFESVKRMASGIEAGLADLIVMGITPTYPSAKYGYVIPGKDLGMGVKSTERFTEKPDVVTAERLISEGAKWNGGVFSFRLGYMTEIAEKYVEEASFSQIIERYDEFPKISFDYEVAEKASNVGMVEYDGEWKDLGTWNTLTDELSSHTYGNVLTDGTEENTHLFNELTIPMLCLGTKDLVVAASPDGIIVAEKSKSESVKEFAQALKQRPMFEERRWGTYKVIDSVEFEDGYCALTKQLTLRSGCAISYQEHACRDEVWTFIDGEGEIVLDGKRSPVKRGMTIFIPKGMKHALKATTSLTFIEVQSGRNLVETDIQRYEWEW